jgi:N-acetylglucosamine-6-phosphate deacetylase
LSVAESASGAREGRLLLDGALVAGRLRFAGGRITAVERLAGLAEEAPVIAPGLVDLHVHGYAGRGPEDDLAGLSRALAAAGTTAYLPTLFPDAPARLGKLAESIWSRRAEAAGGARVLGLHLEGPFVNPRKAGGLPPDRLHAPAPGALRALLGSATAEGRGIRQLTVAPELPGSAELIAELATLGVRVSLGHSAATSAEAARAADHGARGATHLFNAMGAIHHREATLASFALASDALVSEIIGDLVHVGPEAFRIALRARGPLGLALVSDALKGAGTPESEFESHGRRCRIKDGAIWLVEDDPTAPARLTGAEACQLEAVRRLVRAGVADLATALTLASESPARALGLEHELGRLALGARADLLVLDPRTLVLREVLVGGARP